MDVRDLLTPALGPEDASWIRERLMRREEDADGIAVGVTIPSGYEHYARIFHPAYKGATGEFPLRWGTLAHNHGDQFGPTVVWEDLAHQGAAQGIAPPSEGSLPEDEAKVLAQILRKYTSSHSCYFGIWTGYGALQLTDRWPDAPILSLPYREYALLRGPIEAATYSFEEKPFEQSPNLWWPEDSAWFVATEIDFSWTYVGGSADCIEAILSCNKLEAIRVSLQNRTRFATG